MALNNPIIHSISKVTGSKLTSAEREKYRELIVVLFVLLGASFLHFVFGLFTSETIAGNVFDAGIVIVTFSALKFILNNKVNRSMNMVFTVPLFVYAYYISDFTLYAQFSATIYQSVAFLLAGAFFLLYFSPGISKVLIYSIISFFTIVFQLLKADQFFGFLAGPEIIMPHPLVLFIFVLAGGYLIRRKFKSEADQLNYELSNINLGVSKVLRETRFPVMEVNGVVDEAGNIVHLLVQKVNNAFESKFNIRLHEITGQDANYVFNLVLRDHFNLNNLLLFDSKKSQEFYAENLDLWFKTYVLMPRTGTYYIILEDITKAKKKIKELEISKQRYKVLLEAIPDMFFVIGEDGTYEDFVIKESDLYKMEDTAIIGSSIYDVGFPDNMADKIMSCIKSCLRSNTIETIEYSLNTPNGTYLFEMRLAKLSAGSVISVSRDITRRKTAEFNLEKAKRKAEESDRLKSAFLANLSHEIRTPLNIITNFTRMLAEEGLSMNERTELSDAITQNGTQLLNMIDNTIHLSKIETNTVDYSISFCRVNSLIRDVYNRFRSTIPDGRQVTIHLNIDVPNSEFGFVTDKRLLMESLQILVDNAVKYTPEGKIYMGYEMLRNELVKFTVSDTGIGIPQEEMMNIFSRFYRIKNEINEITSGSGIGLSIAQHYIQLLGGELQLESTPGKGTTFWFLIPFREGKGYLRVVS